VYHNSEGKAFSKRHERVGKEKRYLTTFFWEEGDSGRKKKKKRQCGGDALGWEGDSILNHRLGGGNHISTGEKTHGQSRGRDLLAVSPYTACQRRPQRRDPSPSPKKRNASRNLREIRGHSAQEDFRARRKKTNREVSVDPQLWYHVMKRDGNYLFSLDKKKKVLIQRDYDHLTPFFPLSKKDPQGGGVAKQWCVAGEVGQGFGLPSILEKGGKKKFSHTGGGEKVDPVSQGK